MTGKIPVLRISERNRRWWTLGAMCLALFMSMLDSTVVTVALPSIQSDLGASTSSLGWTVNAYTLSFAVLLVTGGRLGDLFGRRRMFVLGATVFGLASLLVAFSHSTAWLIGCRAVQGVGAGFMMPATLSIITNAFPAEERGRAIGLWAGISASALALGPVVAGAMVEDVGWQSVFVLNVPVAALAIAVALLATRESRDEEAGREVDVLGVATLTVGLTALVLALMQSNAWGWGSARVVALFGVAVVALAAFAFVEPRQRVPMIDVGFFRSSTFLGANAVAFVVSFVMFATFFGVTLYLQNTLDYSPLETGLRFLPMTVLLMLSAPLAGRVADRIGPRLPLTLGMLAVAASLFWLTGIAADSSDGFLLVGFVLMGLGLGSVISAMSTAAMNSVAETKAGAASGIIGMARMVGSTFGVAVLAALLGSSADLAGSSGQAGLDETFLHSFTAGLYAMGALALLGGLLGWVLVRGRPIGTAAGPEPPQARLAAAASQNGARVPSEWQPALTEPSQLGVPIDHAVMEPRPQRRRFEDGFTCMTWRDPQRLSPAACDQLYSALPVLASRAFKLDSFPYWRERREERFFDRVSEVSIVLDGNDDIVAWTTMHRQRFDGHRCLYLDSTGVLEQYQHRGFVTRLHGHAIVREVRHRPYRPLWVTMRTENPVIYKMLRRGAGGDHVFPLLSGSVPSEAQRLGQAAADWLGQGRNFRRGDLVLERAYADAYNRYDDDRLECGDARIDSMFRERLAPDEAFIVLAKVTPTSAVSWLARRTVARCRPSST